MVVPISIFECINVNFTFNAVYIVETVRKLVFLNV